MAKIIKGGGGVPAFASLLKDELNDDCIPFDVTFVIVEKGKDNHTQEKEVKAHKLILATFSSVFRAMFFGPIRESKDVIPFQETTVKAFKKMVDYFYQVDIDCGKIGVIEMCDIVNLAEKYNVPKLKEELKEQMEKMEKVPISMENLIEVATAATIVSKFSNFEDVSSVLLLNCAKVLKENIPVGVEQVKFAVDQHATGMGSIALELLTLGQSLECENCQEVNCMKGQTVRRDKLRKGLKVRPNPEPGANAVCGPRCRVVSVVHSVQQGEKDIELLDEETQAVDSYFSTGGGLGIVPALCFNC